MSRGDLLLASKKCDLTAMSRADISYWACTFLAYLCNSCSGFFPQFALHEALLYRRYPGILPLPFLASLRGSSRSQYSVHGQRGSKDETSQRRSGDKLEVVGETAKHIDRARERARSTNAQTCEVSRRGLISQFPQIVISVYTSFVPV